MGVMMASVEKCVLDKHQVRSLWLFCVMLCYAMLCCVMLRCLMTSYAMSCYVI